MGVYYCLYNRKTKECTRHLGKWGEFCISNVCSYLGWDMMDIVAIPDHSHWIEYEREHNATDADIEAMKVTYVNIPNTIPELRWNGEEGIAIYNNRRLSHLIE